MRAPMNGLVAVLVVFGFAWVTAGQGAPSGSVLYEGARLITATGGPPIESSAFLVENGRFAMVGAKGSVRLPSGATRIDLTGKTVMPALIDIHNHLGFVGLPDTVFYASDGSIARTWTGPLTPEALDASVGRLISGSDASSTNA